MKIKILITLLGCFVTFSALSSEGYAIEDALFECMVAEAEAKGVDLISVLDEMEELLIQEGVLSREGGEAKVEYYQKMIDEGATPGLPKSDSRDSFMEISVNVYARSQCTKSVMRMESFQKSKYYQLVQKLERLNREGNVSLIPASMAIVETLKPEDFEHPFYRAYVLLTSFLILDIDSGYNRELPEKSKDDKPIEPEDIFEVILTADNRITVDEEYCTMEELKSRLFDFLKEDGSSFVVRLKTSRKCKYETYANVQTAIQEVYDQIYNEEAMQLFRKKFSELNEESKEEIKIRYPKRLLEVAPD